MADEYISREAVEKAIDSVYTDLYPDCVPNSIAAFRECLLVDIGIIPAADVQSANPWISVNDKLPEPDEKVLVFTKDKDIMSMIYKVIPFRWYKPRFGGFDKDYVTHWKPLPKPPKEESP